MKLKDTLDNRTLTFKDIQLMLDNFDWESHCQRVDEAIAPKIEAYRIARVQSYAQAKYHIYILLNLTQ